MANIKTILEKTELFEKLAFKKEDKIEKLLKKTTFFERLSLYGDRSSFLRKMADQEMANRFFKETGKKSIGDLTEEESKHYYYLKNDSSETPVNSNFTPKQPESPESKKDPYASIPTTPKAKPVQPSNHSYLMDGDHINPEVQKALVRFYPESSTWIKIDGIMGPNTRGALNRYRTEKKDYRDPSDPTFQTDLIRKSYIPAAGR